MRYAIGISPLWRPLFGALGFTREHAYAEVDEANVTLRFGHVIETIPRDTIVSAGFTKWPFYYGLGAKLGPRGGVSYVGSTEGVVELRFDHPRPMQVFGPFRTSEARGVVLSLEEPEAFLTALAR